MNKSTTIQHIKPIKPLGIRAIAKLSKSWIRLSKQNRFDAVTRLRFICLSKTDKYATDYYKGYAQAIEDLEGMKL